MIAAASASRCPRSGPPGSRPRRSSTSLTAVSDWPTSSCSSLAMRRRSSSCRGLIAAITSPAAASRIVPDQATGPGEWRWPVGWRLPAPLRPGRTRTRPYDSRPGTVPQTASFAPVAEPGYMIAFRRRRVVSSGDSRTRCSRRHRSSGAVLPERPRSRVDPSSFHEVRTGQMPFVQQADRRDDLGFRPVKVIDGDISRPAWYQPARC